MIVYNVGRQFYALKVEADSDRRAQALPPRALNKIRIDDRDQLAEFLNGLCETAVLVPDAQDPDANPRIALDDAALDFVPQFVKDDWAVRRRYRDQQGNA